jgi:hypothetical protein
LAVEYGRAGGHDVEGVGEREQRRALGDRVAGQAVGVAAAVRALVVAADPPHLLGGRHVLDDLRAERRVLLDLLVLVRRQPVGLEQHRVGDADLADVVDEAASCSRRTRSALQPRASASAQARRATRSEWRLVDGSLASIARASARIPSSACERASWSTRSSADSSRTDTGS